MQLKHSFTVPASKDETWAAFDDIESVAVCFPGAQVTSVEGDSFEGTVKVKLGPIALVYKGTGTFTEKDESAGTMKIAAKGKDKRGNGTAGADVVATLTGNGDSTDVEVVTDLNITGKPAQFGRGVMQDVSDKLLGQFITCLESKVGDGSAGQDEAPAAAAPQEPDVAANDGHDDAGGGGGTSTGGGGGAGGPSVVPPPGGGSASGAGAGLSAVPSPNGSASSGAGTATGGGSSAAASSRPGASAQQEPEAIDLGATVLPVLAKAYWKQALAGVVAVAVVAWVINKLR